MSQRGAAVVSRVVRTERPEISDRALLQRFAAEGDQSAFTTLVRRYSGLVLGVCKRALANDQDAEDACQATFVVLARKAGDRRWQESIANWLYTTARKICRNAQVAAERRTQREGRAAVREMVTDLDHMTGREAFVALDEELDRLPPRYRAPLVLCYLQGLTRDEAASRLGISPATLKSQLDRGRRRLGDALTKRGIIMGAGILASAITSPAGASPPRLIESIGAAVAGKSSPSLATLAGRAAMKGFANKVIVGVVAVAAATVLGLGLGEPPATTAGPRPVKKEAAPATPQAAKTIAVAGKVFDPEGKPVAGAKFFIIDDDVGSQVSDVVSGADGRFRFEMAYPTTVRNPRQIIATAPGFGFDWLSEPREDAVFKLVPDLPINGKVIDLQGKAVAGAIVEVHDVHAGPDGSFDKMLKNWKTTAAEQEEAAGNLNRWVWNRGGLAQAFHTKTAADGTFSLEGFGKDRVVTLLVRAPNLADTYAAIAMRPGFNPTGAPRTPLRLYPPKVTVTMEPDKPVKGVVRDSATGKPLPGIRVIGTAMVNDLPFGAYIFHAFPSPETTTDKDGRYTLRGLAKGKAYIVVADPEEGTEHIHRFAYVEDTIGLDAVKGDITLPRGIVVTGRVTDSVTGKGVASRVFFRPLEKNDLMGPFDGYSPPDQPAPWHRGRDTKTDFDGNYKITVTPGAGVIHVQAYGDGYQRTSREPKWIDEGIVDKQFGHFKALGQGGMYNPEFMHAIAVISLKAGERTATVDLQVKPVPKPKTAGK